MRWENGRIGDLVSIKKGKKAEALFESNSNGASRYLQIGDLHGDGPIKYAKHSKGIYANPCDILLAWDGANAGTVGYGLKGLAGSTLAVLRTNQKIVGTAYLGMFLRSKFKVLNRKASGATIPHISKSVLSSLTIPLPPLPEQDQIAAILEKSTSIRRKRQEQVLLANELIFSIFQEMFGDPVKNPHGWPTQSLNELAPSKRMIVDGPFGSSLKPECYVQTGVRVIRNFNILPGLFDLSEFKFITNEKFQGIRRSEVLAGDILISTKGTVGNVCEMPSLPGNSVLSASGTVRIRLSQNHASDVPFIVAQMNHPSFLKYIRSLESGSNQKYLNLAAIRKIRLLTPPKKLIKKFLKRMRAARKMEFLLTGGRAKLDDLFFSIEKEVFN